MFNRIRKVILHQNFFFVVVLFFLTGDESISLIFVSSSWEGVISCESWHSASMTNALGPGSHQYIIPSFHTTSQLLLVAGPLMLMSDKMASGLGTSWGLIQLGAAERPLGMVGWVRGCMGNRLGCLAERSRKDLEIPSSHHPLLKGGGWRHRGVGGLCVCVLARRLGVFLPACLPTQPPKTAQYYAILRPQTFCSAGLLWPSFLFYPFQFNSSSLDEGLSFCQSFWKWNEAFFFINHRNNHNSFATFYSIV